MRRERGETTACGGSRDQHRRRAGRHRQTQSAGGNVSSSSPAIRQRPTPSGKIRRKNKKAEHQYRGFRVRASPGGSRDGSPKTGHKERGVGSGSEKGGNEGGWGRRDEQCDWPSRKKTGDSSARWRTGVRARTREGEAVKVGRRRGGKKDEEVRAPWRVIEAIYIAATDEVGRSAERRDATPCPN
ncbi:hypothetical protein AJ80_08831, partial [Polytolypa hystricis UAMH7299]